MTKKEALQLAWQMINKYPNKRTALIAKLSEYNISIDEFNDYDVDMARVAEINMLDKRAADLEDIPGFSQIDTMSDDEILRVYQARDELNAKLDDIGRPPTEAEWYKVGYDAEQRIERLKPFYEAKKEEEWEQLEYPSDIIAPFMGPLGAITELVAGATDLRHDFKEDLHERGAFTSWNPLTGFGAWDIAEFKVDPATGQQGFSPELLQMEDELEQLYGIKGEYDAQMTEGGFRDAYKLEQELGSLNQMITENQLSDPRLLGETQ